MTNFKRSYTVCLRDFRCYLRVASLSSTPIICHVHCLYVIKSPRFAFEGQNMTFTVNVLPSCILYRDAGSG